MHEVFVAPVIFWVKVKVLPAKVPTPVIVYVLPQLSLKDCVGTVSVFPETTRLKTVDLLQVLVPITVADVSVALFTRVNVNLATDPQEMPFQLPSNFAASSVFMASLDFEHPARLIAAQTITAANILVTIAFILFIFAELNN